jgi:hypothetical protein
MVTGRVSILKSLFAAPDDKTSRTDGLLFPSVNSFLAGDAGISARFRDKDGGRHRGQVDDTGGAGVCFQNDYAGTAEHPSTDFAGVHEQSTVAIGNHTWSVRVCEHNYVGFINAVAKLIQLVSHHDSGAIADLMTDWRPGEGADDFHATCDADLVPVVVTKASDDGAGQFSH